MGGTPQGGFVPRGLSRVHAAAYVGVSPSTFDKLVEAGQMPGPKRLRNRVIWDRHQIDIAFDALPGGQAEGEDEDTNEWDG